MVMKFMLTAASVKPNQIQVMQKVFLCRKNWLLVQTLELEVVSRTALILLLGSVSMLCHIRVTRSLKTHWMTFHAGKRLWRRMKSCQKEETERKKQNTGRLKMLALMAGNVFP